MKLLSTVKSIKTNKNTAIKKNSSDSSYLIRWAGSKRKLLPVLLPYTQKLLSDRYIEPFLGSGCLFFSLPSTTAIVGDINKDLINLYDKVKHAPEELYAHFSTLKTNKEDYYIYRNQFNKEENSLIKASLFLYLNKLSFNGIYRTNKKGEFNVPIGSRYGKLPNLEKILSFSEKLKDVKLINGDFIETLKCVRENDLIYLDPPYDYSGRIDRGEYGEGSFKAVDLNRLSESLEKIDLRGAKFILSYLDVPDVDFIKARWHSRDIQVKRQVASFASKRKSVSELIISNVKIF